MEKNKRLFLFLIIGVPMSFLQGIATWFLTYWIQGIGYTFANGLIGFGVGLTSGLIGFGLFFLWFSPKSD